MIRILTDKQFRRFFQDSPNAQLLANAFRLGRELGRTEERNKILILQCFRNMDFTVPEALIDELVNGKTKVQIASLFERSA